MLLSFLFAFFYCLFVCSLLLYLIAKLLTLFTVYPRNAYTNYFEPTDSGVNIPSKKRGYLYCFY
jgi:hypothetical protein